MHSSGRISSGSSGSERSRRTFSMAGNQIMTSTKIPQVAERFDMDFGENEEFFLGSPKKRDPHQYEI
jgi:hypothetical protein